MKAVTVFEDENGVVFVVTGDGLTFSEGIALLHQGIADLVKAARDDR